MRHAAMQERIHAELAYPEGFIEPHPQAQGFLLNPVRDTEGTVVFEHILVPVDFTEKNTVALDVAIKLAQQSHGRITLLHVIEPMEYEDDEIRSFYQTLEAKAWEKMKAMVEPVDKGKVPIMQQIILGHRATSIVEYTTTDHVDLLVLSSHKIGFDQPPKSWATLSYRVSILCPCPVLLLK